MPLYSSNFHGVSDKHFLELICHGAGQTYALFSPRDTGGRLPQINQTILTQRKRTWLSLISCFQGTACGVPGCFYLVVGLCYCTAVCPEIAKSIFSWMCVTGSLAVLPLDLRLQWLLDVC